TEPRKSRSIGALVLPSKIRIDTSRWRSMIALAALATSRRSPAAMRRSPWNAMAAGPGGIFIGNLLSFPDYYPGKYRLSITPGYYCVGMARLSAALLARPGAAMPRHAWEGHHAHRPSSQQFTLAARALAAGRTRCALRDRPLSAPAGHARPG